MSLSNDELRAAIMVLHSSTSTTTARIAAHESVMHFEHSVVAWASALHLVQSSQSFYGIYGASILATKAKRGDYVEDRHALVIAILSVLGSIPEFQRSLRCQDETMSVQAELVIAVAAIAAPAPAMLDLLDLPAFQTLKPITALAVLEHMGSADGMSVPDIHVGAVGSRCYSGPVPLFELPGAMTTSFPEHCAAIPVSRTSRNPASESASGCLYLLSLRTSFSAWTSAHLARSSRKSTKDNCPTLCLSYSSRGKSRDQKNRSL